MKPPTDLKTLAMKVRTTFHRRMFLMLRPLDESLPEPSPRGEFAVREMTPETQGAYLAMVPARRGVIDERIRRGARCFLAWDGDQLAHGSWMATDRVRIDYMECDLVLSPDDVYSFDSYSPRRYRGRGLAQALGLHVMHVARAEGRKRAWCLPALENAAGVRTAEAVDYRPVATLHYLRLGPLRRRWSVPPAEPWHPYLAP